MSKSYMIFDTPDACKDCPIPWEKCFAAAGGVKQVQEKFGLEYNAKGRQAWCPLKDNACPDDIAAGGNQKT